MTEAKARTPRLAELARQIEAEFQELETRIEKGYCNTDRKIPGTRLRRPGKGRRGNRLIVFMRGTDRFWRENVVLDHNAAETYRCNDDVVRWMERYREERKKR